MKSDDEDSHTNEFIALITTFVVESNVEFGIMISGYI